MMQHDSRVFIVPEKKITSWQVPEESHDFLIEEANSRAVFDFTYEGFNEGEGSDEEEGEPTHEDDEDSEDEDEDENEE